MPKSTLLKSTLAALIVAGVFSGLFMVWRSNSLPKDGMKKIQALDEMETQGIPKFDGKEISGQVFHLADIKDKVIIVNFWATWCPPCVEELPSLIDLVESMNGKVHLVAVSADNSRDDILSFLKAFPKFKSPNITIIYDEDRSISHLYGVDRFPESFIAFRNQKLVKKIIGGIPWHTKESEGFMAEIYSK